MEDFLVLLICSSPFLFLFAIVFLLFWFLSKKNSEQRKDTNTLNKQTLIRWLKQQKKAGLITIDDLLTKIERSKHATKQDKYKTTKQTLVHKKETQSNEIETKSTKKKDSATDIIKKQSSNATLLLYIGAILVIFSVFIFTAFNWETFSGLIKSFILIGLTLSFYISGIIIYQFKSIKKAGITFITIASIGLGFTGIGLWKFLLENTWTLNFSTYWLGYSIFMTLVYSVSLYLFNLRKYFYFLLISIYSSILSFAFTLTTEIEYRVVVILILNLLFYFSDGILTKFTKEIQFSSRLINQILNVLGILTVIIGLDTGLIHSNIIYLITLFVPTVFSVITWFKQKYKVETLISLLLTPVKIFIAYFVLDLENPNPVQLTLVVTIYTILNTILAEIIFDKKHKLLHAISTFVSGGLIFITTLFYILMSASNSSSYIFSTDAKLFVLIVNSSLLILPHLAKNRRIIFAIGINYLIFSSYQILAILNENFRPIHLIILLTLIETLGLLLHYLIHKKKIKNFYYSLLPIILISGIISITIGLEEKPLDRLVSFTILSIVLTIISRLHKIKFIDLVTIPINLVAYVSFFKFLEAEAAIEIQMHHYGMIFLIPVLFYLIKFEINKINQKYIYPFIIGALFFWIISIFLTIKNNNFLLISLIISLTYWIYAQFRFRKSFITYLIYLFSNLITWQILNIQNQDVDIYILSTSLLTIMFTIVSYIKSKSPILKLEDRTRKHFSLSTIISTTILFPIIFVLVITDPSNATVLAALALGLNLAIASRRYSFLADFAGIGLVLALWNYIFQLDFNSLVTQFIFLPITLWILILSFKYYLKKKKRLSLILESGGYILHSLILLSQSVFLSEEENILYGIILIGVSILILLWGVYRDKKALIIISIIFLITELIIRLYIILIDTPWYIYVCLFGMILLGIAIYIMWRIGRYSSEEKPKK
ncbi:DUF2157 domain-containing protein [Candidatus Dojkabacteria bacterium]|nr:DUF2157 domain-containing protein [Candidatus Dojkabacteria bacterium]